MVKWFCLLWLLLFPFGAQAEEHCPNFFRQCPDHIRAHLILQGMVDAEILCGASDEYTGNDMINSVLLLARERGEYSLIGLQWTNGQDGCRLRRFDHLPWALEEITGMEVVQDTETRFALLFSDGSRREIACHTGGNWRLHSYHAPDGTEIFWRAGELVANGVSYLTTYSCWLSDLPAVRVFPTTQEEAAAIAQRSWEGLDGCAFGSAHLREEPSTSSRSLGQYSKTRMQVITWRNGWYKVRIGDTEGWMSETYVHFPSDREEAARHCTPSMPTAIALDGCTLWSAMEEGRLLRQLNAGDEMRILAQTADGWLHVLVPSGELRWELGMDGLYGYVRRESIETLLFPAAP